MGDRAEALESAGRVHRVIASMEAELSDVQKVVAREANRHRDALELERRPAAVLETPPVLTPEPEVDQVQESEPAETPDVEPEILADSSSADEAARRVAKAPDHELAELFAIATNPRPADDPQAEYWQILARATVEEAANRPQFGEDSGDESDLKRRERRRRAKRIAQLDQARRSR